ncbi:MAG: SIS domain-containing protein [Alphaproteobacteria bacterium]|nr:SIS domain-containing protein [Alphaproteobacteria bacterium]
MKSLSQHLLDSAALIASMPQHSAALRADAAVAAIAAAFKTHKPLLVCGNGGSAADAQHIAGEMVGRFLKERRGYPCIALTADSAIMTAVGNDYGYEQVFVRQVEAYGQAGGVLWGISTSGNSANVVAAFTKAKTLGLTTIAMTGEGGGKLAALTDILIDVPSRHTPYIQQVHLCLYHYICEAVEAALIP